MISAIRHLEQLLTPAYPADEAKALAWWIAEELTGKSRSELLTGKSTAFSPTIQTRAEIIVERLLRHEPIQYIFSATYWRGLRLHVTPDTLIPRPETAELIDWAAEIFAQQPPRKIIDYCTGSGCIAIALQQLFPSAEIIATDKFTSALEIAKQNIDNLYLPIRTLQDDVLTPPSAADEALLQGCDLIVSNPPYICQREQAAMEANVLDYEPHQALFVPDDQPLLFYQAIARRALRQLNHGGYLLLEINQRYGAQVVNLLQTMGFQRVTLRQDSYQNDRFVGGQKV